MMSSPRRVQKSNAVADRLRGPKVPPTPPAPPRKRINNALNVVTLYKVDFTPVIFFKKSASNNQMGVIITINIRFILLKMMETVGKVSQLHSEWNEAIDVD